MKLHHKLAFLFIILPILMIGGYFFAQNWKTSPSVDAALRPQQGTATRGMVFCVTQGSNTIFLVGSVHMLTKADYPLPSVFESVFSQAEEIVFEIPPNDFAADQVQSALRQFGVTESGLSGAAGDAVHGWLKTQGLSKNTFQGMAPWRVATTIAAMTSKSVGLEAEQGIDSYFRMQSVAKGKRTTGLERITEQFQIFANLSAETQSMMVVQSVKESASATADLAALLAAWRAGNLTELEARTAKSFAACPEAKRAILDDRNAAWWPKLHEFIDSPATELVIVGAAHLAGPQGLVARFRAAGCNVEQL